MQRWAGKIGLTVAVGAIYFLAAQFGLALFTASERGVVFWPGSGIAAGTLIVFGLRMWAPVTAGVTLATLAANLGAEKSLWVALAFGLCNAGEALLMTWLIERWFGLGFTVDSLRRLFGFLAATVVATGTAAVGAACAMSLFGPSVVTFLGVWEVRFASGAFGMLTVAPMLIGIAGLAHDPPRWRQLVEGTLALVLLAVMNGLALTVFVGPWSMIAPTAVLFPLLLWLSVRYPPAFAAAGVFIIAVAIVWTTANGYGRYGDPSRPTADRVIAGQVDMLATALAVLAFAALFAERRRHEVVVCESDTRQRSILNAANVIAWDVDLIRNTVHFEGPVGRFLDRPDGSDSSDIAAFVDCIHPEERDDVMAKFWSAVSTADAYQLEFRLLLPGRGVCWVTAEGSVERDAHGRPLRVRGITRDITERKKAELALTERDTQLALAGKAAGVGSYVTDFDAERMQISPGYATIHGLAEGTREIASDEWRTRVHPEDLRRLDALRSQAFAAQKREHSAEYRILDPDGKVRWIEARAIVSYDSEGRAERMVGVNIDVTERKQAEDQQSLLIAELDHRVKNMLASVAVVARRTSEHSGSPKDFINALDSRIQSMANAHALLSRSRWRGVSLAELVRHELAPYATASNTSVEGPDVGLATATTQAIAMVLHELATNAAKYGALSTSQGRVFVRWDRQSNGTGPAKLRLEWREQGGPSVATPPRPGYGTTVIRNLIPYELGGMVELMYRADGVCCTIEIAIENDTGPR